MHPWPPPHAPAPQGASEGRAMLFRRLSRHTLHLIPKQDTAVSCMEVLDGDWPGVERARDKRVAKRSS